MLDLRWIRQYLSDDAAVLAANALVSSRLNYCNSLLRSLSSFHILFPILKNLRCIFKTATLVYKFLHSGHPNYFSPHLSIHCGRYGTRYNHPDKRFLEVPQFYPSVHKSKRHFGHSFAFDAPTLWNDLPEDVHSAPTLACFRKKLKSYLFDKAFPPYYLNFMASTWLCL